MDRSKGFFLDVERDQFVLGSKVAFFWGWSGPTFNRNPYNGYINPYGIGLMSLSPIIWKCHGS